MSDLVGNPEDGFSHDEAHIIASFVTLLNACKGRYDVRGSIKQAFFVTSLNACKGLTMSETVSNPFSL